LPLLIFGLRDFEIAFDDTLTINLKITQFQNPEIAQSFHPKIKIIA